MKRSRVGMVLLMVAGGAGAGCGGGFKTVAASQHQQQNVMVIDEGIDLSVAELQGRVSATYTEICADDSESDDAGDGTSTNDAEVVDAGPEFNSLKAMFIASLSVPDDSCHLTPGISAKTDPLASIDKYKDRWNQMIEAGETASTVFSSAEIAQLMGPLNNELMTFGYHGTATSTTVAHENPNVRLVLVERQLESESSIQTNFPCVAQADIDQFVDLMNDPQVYAAYVNQPAQLDADLSAAMTKGDVGEVSESFGSEPRSVLEKLQTMNCPSSVDLSAYFTILDKATLAHEATIQGPAVLTVQAAGNDGVEIDSGTDSLDCDLGDPKALMVGSYDPTTNQQNVFSNFGACVGVFAPGQGIIVRYAGGWLLPADGTSFATPLTVRAISLTAPTPFSAPTAQAAIVAQRNAVTQFLPLSLFPSDVFYVPSQVTTDAVLPGVSHRPPVQLTQHDLHRILRPLRLLRGLRKN